MSNNFTFETETQRSIMKQDKLMARKQKETIINWEHTLSISNTVPSKYKVPSNLAVLILNTYLNIKTSLTGLY